MKYRLKSGCDVIEAVDGPCAGKRYEPGKWYDTIPDGDRHKFETDEPIEPASPAGEYAEWSASRSGGDE